MADPFAASAWAWAQQLPCEEKLLLLALASGEIEPNLHDAVRLTGLPLHGVQDVAERLHARGLIDDQLRPKVEHGSTDEGKDAAPDDAA